MPHMAKLNQGLHCLLIQNRSNIFLIHNIKYTMGHPDFIVCSFMENAISLKGLTNKSSGKLRFLGFVFIYEHVRGMFAKKKR